MPRVKARYRQRGARVQKTCTRCGEWKYLEDFYENLRARDGRHSQCKICHNAAVSRRRYGTSEGRGLIRWGEVKPYMTELIRRVGKAEAARRMGITKPRVTQLMGKRDHEHVQRRTAAKILVALRDVRSEGLVRSRRDIRRGAAARGEPEKRPQSKHEFYHVGDYSA